MRLLLITCTLALIAACGGASRPSTSRAQTIPQRCGLACWEVMGKLLAETCRCKTEECAESVSARMESWVATEIVDKQHLTGREEEVELSEEFRPYWEIEDACTEKFRPPPKPHRRRAFVNDRVVGEAP